MHMLPGIRISSMLKTYAGAVRRITVEEADVNIGVLGISSPRGDAFLDDLASRIDHWQE